MTEFVASNGWRVRAGEVSGKAFVDIDGGMASAVLNMLPSQFDALREFFLAERDAELGRWRSKEHPEYVVYIKGAWLVWFDESDGTTGSHLEGHSATYPNSQSLAVIREYQAAHPEPKPWHDAKPGEVWALKLSAITDREYAYIRQDGLRVTTDGGAGWKNLTPDQAPTVIGLTAPAISSGRRIWPEV